MSLLSSSLAFTSISLSISLDYSRQPLTNVKKTDLDRANKIPTTGASLSLSHQRMVAIVLSWVSFCFSRNLGLGVTPGDWSWWEDPSIVLSAFPHNVQPEPDGRGWKNGVWLTKSTVHVKTRQASSARGHGFPHPALALIMLLLKVCFISWQPPDTK